MQERRMRQAKTAVDGLRPYHNWHPTDFLALDLNGVNVMDLKPVGGEGEREESADPLIPVNRVRARVKDGRVTDEPVTFVGSSRQGVGFVKITAPVVENAYVIKNGMRMLYCNSLLKIVRARLGRLPNNDLQRRVVRRTAMRLCEQHGLRPGDTELTVEVVVRMFWRRTALEDEIDCMSEELELAELGLIQRIWRRLWRRKRKRIRALSVEMK